MSNEIDWTALSRSLGLLDEQEADGWGESGSSDAARAAILELLGPETLQAAVDFYVSGQPGFELARSVLWLLHPWPAMERCYEIFRSAQEPADRQSAVELLRVVADRRVLNWVSEFLDDSDETIQAWGIGIVDQLAWSRMIGAEEAQALVMRYQGHQNPEVRKTVSCVEKYLDKRAAVESND